MIKVLHVIPSLSKEKGGPTQITLEMIQALRQQGVEAEIVTTNDNGKKVLDVPLYQCVEYEQVPVWFVPRFALPLKDFIFSAALTRWLWQHIEHYDLVHTHYLFSYAPTCAAIIARWQKIPYIVTPYGMLTPWALNHQRRKKQVYAPIERQNLRHAIAAHCSTKEECQDVANFRVNTPTFMVPYGVKVPLSQTQAPQQLRRRYQIAPETPVVLFLSRFHSKKRPDLLIQALGKLVAQNQPFHLLLAGSGTPEYESYLHNLIHSLGLDSCTSFTGFVTGTEKQILLQGADVFVLPSFSENFGIAVVEAMLARLPVIITPEIYIATDIAAAQAGIVVEGEVEKLVEAITKVLKDSQLRQQLGNLGFQLAQQRYSWRAIASQLSDIYSKLLSSSLP